MSRTYGPCTAGSWGAEVFREVYKMMLSPLFLFEKKKKSLCLPRTSIKH